MEQFLWPRSDPTFFILVDEENENSNVKQKITDLVLKPIVPIHHLPFDNFPQGFLDGGLVLANLDAVFNFTGLDWEGKDANPLRYPSFQVSETFGKLFWDLGRNPLRGGSEYWLWRNTNSKILTEDNADILNFRSDLVLYPDKNVFLFPMYDFIQPTEFLTKKWLEYVLTQSQDFPDLVGNTDSPTNFNDFYYQIALVLLRGMTRTWFFFPLPDDQRVEQVLSVMRVVCSFLTVIRIVSSPYPFVIGQLQSTGPFDNVLKQIEKIPLTGEIPTEGEIDFEALPEKFYNLKRLSTIWRIPSERPSKT